MAASVSVSANQGSQIATLTGSALTDQFDQVLALAADILLNPSFPEKELALYKVRARAALEEQRSDPDFLREERYSKAMYGDHPASSIGADARSLEKITRDALVAFHKSNYVPDHAIIGVSGDITLAEARTKFEAALKAGRRAANRGRASSIRRTRPVEDLARESSRFGADRVSCSGEPAINRTHPDYDAMTGDEPDPGRHPTAVCTASCASGRATPTASTASCGRFAIAATGARRWMCGPKSPSRRCATCSPSSPRCATRWCPTDEFKDAQRSLTASFALSLENPAELLNLYIVRQLYNFPVDYWDRYTDRITAVTPAQVQTVARKYRIPNDFRSSRSAMRRRSSRLCGRSARSSVFDDEGKAG